MSSVLSVTVRRPRRPPPPPRPPPPVLLRRSAGSALAALPSSVISTSAAAAAAEGSGAEVSASTASTAAEKSFGRRGDAEAAFRRTAAGAAPPMRAFGATATAARGAQRALIEACIWLEMAVAGAPVM